MRRLTLILLAASLGACNEATTPPAPVDQVLQAQLNAVNVTLVRAWGEGRRVDLITWTGWDSTQAPVLIMRLR